MVLSEGRRGSTVRRGISLWEIPTLDPIWRLDAAPVGYPAISPDNSLIAFLGHIGGKFGLIVYEWKSEKLTTLKELPFSLKDYYTSYLWATPVNNRLIFSPDGTLLILSGVLTTNQRAIVAVWSTSTWDEISLLSVDLRTIAGSDADKILEISLSPNNKFIAITFLVESIGEDGGILILDATNGNKICENKGVGKIAARRAMFSPDGKKVAVVASDGNPFQHFFYIRILDVFTCESIQEIKYPKKFYFLILLQFLDENRVVGAVVPEGNRSSVEYPKMEIWDITTGELLDWINLYVNDHFIAYPADSWVSWISDISVSPDKKYFVSVGRNDGDRIFIPDSDEVILWNALPDISSNSYPDDSTPDQFKIYPNYPNPTSDHTTFVIDSPSLTIININLWDILGRNILSLPNIRLPSGKQQEVKLNNIDLPSGIYLYQITSTQNDKLTHTGKLVIK